MSKRILPVTKFNGGIASNDKEGIASSFQWLRSFEVRKNPTLLTVAPGPKKISGTVVTDLILDSVRVSNGDTYFIGNTGKFYKLTAGGVMTYIDTLGENSGGSLVYRQDTDYIYITGQTKVGRYGPLAGTPGFTASKYGPMLDASKANGAQTYTVPTSIVESALAKLAYEPNIDPVYSIKLKVVAKGTGDVTVTLHDEANNAIGSKTITNANLTNGALNEFVFANPLPVQPNVYGADSALPYHFHITVTSGTTTVQTTTASDFNSADHEIYGSLLKVTNNGLHPATIFQQYLVIGNGRYVSIWEPLSENPTKTEWVHHRLTFPPGYEVCGIDVYDEFLAIACEKRSSSATATFQDGKVFFWDGVADYNFFLNIPQGTPLPIFNESNILHFLSKGEWYGYGGGQPQKVRRFPKIDGEFTNQTDAIVNYPNTMTVRKGVVHVAFPSQTANRSIEHGVYSYGSLDKNYPPCFTLEYVPSHGVRLNDGSNNLRLGMIKNFGEDMFISWRNGTDYGLDIVNNTCAPATSADLISLIFDNSMAWKPKKAYRLKATMLPLPTGSSLKLKYRIDREDDWTYSDEVTVGATECILDIAGKRFYEIEFGLEVVTDGVTMTSPAITSIAFEFDDLREEAMI